MTSPNPEGAHETNLLIAKAYLHAFADGYKTGKMAATGEMPPNPEVETALWLWSQGSPALASLSEEELRDVVLAAARGQAP